MTGPGPADLTALHRRILEAKGGTFGPVSVRPAPVSWGERSSLRLRRLAARIRRVGR
jgi:hypothetical protein